MDCLRVSARSRRVCVCQSTTGHAYHPVSMIMKRGKGLAYSPKCVPVHIWIGGCVCDSLIRTRSLRRLRRSRDHGVGQPISERQALYSKALRGEADDIGQEQGFTEGRCRGHDFCLLFHRDPPWSMPFSDPSPTRNPLLITLSACCSPVANHQARRMTRMYLSIPPVRFTLQCCIASAPIFVQTA